MSDNKIDRLNTLVELIRLRSTEGRQRTSSNQGIERKDRRDPDALGHVTGPRDIEALRGRLSSQLKNLRDDGSDGILKSSHVVVREILLWEFGQGLEKHPEFDSILAAVDAAFSENSALKQKMGALIGELKT